MSAAGTPRNSRPQTVYFARDARYRDQVGNIDANTRAIFGRSYVAEPDVLVKELAGDEAIKGPIRCSSRSRTSRVWTTTPPCSTASSSTSLRNSGGADGERS